MIMIKVIEGHKAKLGANIQPVFLKFRSNAMQYPGFIGAENLLSVKDASMVLFVSTWETVKNWEIWEESSMRRALYQEANALLADEPKVNIYRIVPTQW
jgi:heme-degrading monooxygenase HmoA